MRRIRSELEETSKALLKARQERLRLLYAEDMARWEAELAAKGLAIERRHE
jgi:hypothetical protein